MLNLPPAWIPDVALDCDEVRRAVTRYRQSEAVGQSQWVNEHDLKIVGKYLVYFGTELYWRVILEDDARGYSLLLHEGVELDWYAGQGVNAFDAEEQRRWYREAHSLALLAEHRFLQAVAQGMGYAFTLAQLIMHNPHGDPPDPDQGWDGDWQLVLEYQRASLTAAEQVYRPERQSEVEEFYRRLGFQGV